MDDKLREMVVHYLSDDSLTLDDELLAELERERVRPGNVIQIYDSSRKALENTRFALYRLLVFCGNCGFPTLDRPQRQVLADLMNAAHRVLTLPDGSRWLPPGIKEWPGLEKE